MDKNGQIDGLWMDLEDIRLISDDVICIGIFFYISDDDNDDDADEVNCTEQNISPFHS